MLDFVGKWLVRAWAATFILGVVFVIGVFVVVAFIRS